MQRELFDITSMQVVEGLVRRGADADAQDNDGQTPLHYSAVCEHLEVKSIGHVS